MPRSLVSADSLGPPEGHTSAAAHYVETIFYIRVEEGRVRPGRLATWMGVSAPMS